MLHDMKLNAGPFEQIKNGIKTIEVRLNDQKRRRVKPGDTIRFSKLPACSETLLVRVTERLEYPTFAELYASAEPEQFGGENAGQLLRETYAIYTPEREKECGVLGLRIELLPQA